MEANRPNEIIVEILQKSLAHKIEPSCHFSPQDVADAIVTSVNFNKPYIEIKNGKIVDVIKNIVLEYKNQMNKEYDNLLNDEGLLKNFVQGKINAYDEVLQLLKDL